MDKLKNQRGFSLPLVVAGLAVLFVIGGAVSTYLKNTDIKDELSLVDGLMARSKDNETVEPGAPLITGSSTASTTRMGGSIASSSPGRFEDYEADKVSAAVDERIVLFFYAGWSEKSREVAMNIATNSDQIPAGILILKVDFDRRLSLRGKYKVIAENTFVEVNHEGREVNQWSGSATLAEMIMELD
jgi:hypothetical protein